MEEGGRGSLLIIVGKELVVEEERYSWLCSVSIISIRTPSLLYFCNYCAVLATFLAHPPLNSHT